MRRAVSEAAFFDAPQRALVVDGNAAYWCWSSELWGANVVGHGDAATVRALPRWIAAERALEGLPHSAVFDLRGLRGIDPSAFLHGGRDGDREQSVTRGARVFVSAGPRVVRGGWLCALVLATLSPTFARADALPPADTNACPPGALEERSHVVRSCAPTTCTSDASCTDPERSACAPQVGLCVTTRSVRSGHLSTPPSEWPTVSFEDATGACSSDQDCADGSRCIVAPRCVPASSGIGPIAGAGALVLGAGALFAIWVRARRR